MATAADSPLLRLPDEILASILQNLTVTRLSFSPSPSPTSTETRKSHRPCVESLAAVASCCRRLLPIAESLLHQSAVISDLDQRVPVLAPYLPRLRRATTAKERPTTSRRCYILYASANGKDLLVRNLAQAAAQIASHNNHLPLAARRQAYLSSHFRTSTDCPCRHWPSLFPTDEHGRSAIDSHLGLCCDSDKGKEGGDPDNGGSSCINHGFTAYTTPLHAASQNGCTSTARLLLTLLSSSPSGMPVDMMTTTTTTFLPASVLLHQSALLRALDAPAHLACLCPSRHMHALMRSSAGLGRGSGSISDADSWPACTPLMLALAHGHDEVAKLLIAAGATWAVPITTPSPANGCLTTALHIMAANSRLGVLEWLVDEVQRGATADQCQRHRGYCDWPDDQGLFPLHYAALADTNDHHHHALRLVRAMISLGADPDPGQHTVMSLLRQIRINRREAEASIPSPLGSEEMLLLQQTPTPTRLLPTPLEILRPTPDSIWHWQNAPAASLHLHRFAHQGALESFDQVVGAITMAAYGPMSAAEKVAGSNSEEWRTVAEMAQKWDEQGGVDEQRSSAKVVQAIDVALRLRHLDALEGFLDGTLEVLQDDDTPASEDEGTESEGEGLTCSSSTRSHTLSGTAVAGGDGAQMGLNSTACFASAHGNRVLAEVLQAQKSPSSS